MILDVTGSNEIGWYFSGIVAEIFLNGGFILATRHSVGKNEYFMLRLHILEIGFATVFAPAWTFS